MELTDKVAVVTGATSGIGTRIAQRFAEWGASVAVAGRDMEAAQEIVEGIKASGGQAISVTRQLGMSVEDALKTELLKNTVDQQPGSVDEVADLALFLAQQDTAALSGQSFNCGHGIHMQ
ncbi:SDR family NAD(P)-dependent oxidoreductase [Halomonas sp. 11-S5]|uniref:SDR family NAD(P)-dependent oxidoreductase n=1 Tax=Halomonas sp. 11-S5 TaxID=2994064 RepID=UPI002468303B|nr:SDR family NAD(P)-dependent oxidoreductase [Halomonas sp. 11-S5]